MPTAIRTCPLCEATCGLEVTVDGDRASRASAATRGRLLPRLPLPQGRRRSSELHDDPDRLRTPLVRTPDGDLAPATWDEAFAVIAERLPPILAEHGRDAVAVYLGNPTRPQPGGAALRARAAQGARHAATSSRPAPSTSTPSRWPRRYMFGSGASVAGARPRPHRLPAHARRQPAGVERRADDRARRARPPARRSASAAARSSSSTRGARAPRSVADEHLSIRPGTDALLLMALVHVLFAEGLVAPGRSASTSTGVDEVARARRRLHARGGRGRDAGSRRPTIAAHGARARRRAERRRLRAHRHDDAGASARPRAGSSTCSTCSPATSTGRAARCSRPGRRQRRTPRGEPGRGRGARFGRWASRVRGAPRDLRRAAGRVPGRGDRDAGRRPGPRADHDRRQPGRVDAERDAAGRARSASLDFMVSIDLYVNETTRHADVILPVPSPLERSHYDLALLRLRGAQRGQLLAAGARAPDGMPDEWETLLRLTGDRHRPGRRTRTSPRSTTWSPPRRRAARPRSRLAGRGPDPAEVLASLAPGSGPSACST